MHDYARLYRRTFQEKTAARQIRMIKQLIRRDLPVEIMLVLIVTVIYPSLVMQVIRK